jgi:uncharacterized protein YbjQ (UPF0145 family)
MESIFALGIQLAFLVVIYFIGTRWIEKRHYESIKRRENIVVHKLPTFSIQKEIDLSQVEQVWLVMGSTVISIDAFKKFIAGLVNLLGGRVKVYESLLDRAKRESVLRMQEQAIKQGASSIINVRIETSPAAQTSKNTVGSIEVLAYGTALKHPLEEAKKAKSPATETEKEWLTQPVIASRL